LLLPFPTHVPNFAGGARVLTKSQAATRLGITQSRLDDLLRGEIDEFSR